MKRLLARAIHRFPVGVILIPLFLLCGCVGGWDIALCVAGILVFAHAFVILFCMVLKWAEENRHV